MLRAIGVSLSVRLVFYPTHQLIVTAHAHIHPLGKRTHNPSVNAPKHISTHPLPQQNLHHARSHRERKLLRRRESLGTPRGGRGYPVSCEMARVPGVGKYVGTQGPLQRSRASRDCPVQYEPETEGVIRLPGVVSYLFDGRLWQ